MTTVEAEEKINNLKKHVFYELLSQVGRVLVLVKHSSDVIIGTRGFLEEEKESGLVLVFNSSMKFAWDKYGITATLVFGSTPQKCFIPTDNIAAVYSPELNAQFVTSAQEKPLQRRPRKPAETPVGKAQAETVSEPVPLSAVGEVVAEDGRNVITVDFVKRKRLEKETKE